MDLFLGHPHEPTRTRPQKNLKNKKHEPPHFSPPPVPRQTMGEGVFFDHNPDMLTGMDEEVKAEKMSQLQLFYRGKFGHEPDPFFWSFEPSSSNGAAFLPQQPPQPLSSRFPRGGGSGGDDESALRRPVNPNALYPAGSGRFPRDLSGSMRTGGRHDRLPRPAPPGSPSSNWRRPDGEPPFNPRWNDNGEGDAGRGGDGGDEEGKAPSKPSPYLPKLENFIGNYHERREETPTSVGAGGDIGGDSSSRKRSAQHMQTPEDDASTIVRGL